MVYFLAPLSAAELLAARARHEDRQHALRVRGWAPIQILTRSAIYDAQLTHVLARTEEVHVQLWDVELRTL